MKFAHLIEINDPLNPLIVPISRSQLWRGLVLRAENPKLFVPWLDDCRILARSEQSISRELRYGDLIIRDQVTLLELSQLWFHVPAQGDIPVSSLVMTIEEPQPGLLFVRFEYDTDGAKQETTEDAFYNEYRRSAYVDADIETICLVRAMAAEGRLDEAAG